MSQTHSQDTTAGLESLMAITPRPDAVMVRGRGSHLWDAEGRRYLDFVQGWAVNALGHCPPEILDALGTQAGQLIHAAAAFHNAPQLDLARALTDACGLDEVFFCNSGAEANEGAIKLARKWGQLHRGGASTILTTEGSFHGRTLATMAASGKPRFAERFPPAVPGFRHVPFGDAHAVEAAIDAHTVAVMVEPIQGEAGVVVPPDGYLGALRELTRDRGVLLICDEIQTGMGRTGALFCHQHDGVVPDIMTLGKGLGGGVPLAALLCTRATASFEPGDQGGTFNGNPLMTAVGLAVLRAVTRDGLLDDVNATGAYLQQRLQQLGEAHGAQTRGRGLLVAMVLRDAVAPRVRDLCMERGVLINAAQPDVLRFMPALNVTRDHVDDLINTLRGALEDAHLQRVAPSRE